MPGDVVQIQGYAKYATESSTSANLTGFASALLSAFDLSAPAVGETGTASSALNAWATGGRNSGSDATPKVFVTILIFDDKYNFLDAAFHQSSGSNTLMAKSYTIKQPGYVFMYVSNEHTKLLDVYVDDVTMTHTPSPIVSMQDYYPFGLTFNSFQRENSVDQKYLYNGKELQDELNLGWLDYGARMYITYN